jgi:ATPase subunit of ABC transporter with duplicated ATPase domains
MADVDFGKIKLFVGNYDFWYESSQSAIRMMKDQNKKKEEKVKQLQELIARFSTNASKSKQAISRKKILGKITLDDIQPSNRKFPYVGFKPEREVGNDILFVDNLSKTLDGEKWSRPAAIINGVLPLPRLISQRIIPSFLKKNPKAIYGVSWGGCFSQVMKPLNN